VRNFLSICFSFYLIILFTIFNYSNASLKISNISSLSSFIKFPTVPSSEHLDAIFLSLLSSIPISFNLVVAQILFILLVYSFIQIYLNVEKLKELANKTMESLRAEESMGADAVMLPLIQMKPCIMWWNLRGSPARDLESV